MMIFNGIFLSGWWGFGEGTCVAGWTELGGADVLELQRGA